MTREIISTLLSIQLMMGVNHRLFMSTYPLKIDISEPIMMFELGPLVKQTIVDTDNAPKRASYQDKNYFLSDEFLGHCKSVDDDDDEWSEFVTGIYNEDESESSLEL